MKSKNKTRLLLFGIFVFFLIAFQYYNHGIPPKIESVADRAGVSYLFARAQETNGQKHLVPIEEIISGGTLQDAIPSIDEPVFESIAAADFHLSDEGRGIVIEENGQHRFYPYQILAWHEIVNDRSGVKNLTVTYCPLCKSASVFEHENERNFGTSGKLLNNNLVMYDHETGTYWAQLLATGILGELTGNTLSPHPFEIMSWDAFKESYPNGEVLSRDTGASRDYTEDPYWNYYESDDIFFALSIIDARLKAKEEVVGYHKGTEYAKAWPVVSIKERTVVNDEVAGVPIVLMHDREFLTIRTFLRLVDNRILTFQWDGDRLIDQETGSVWGFDGTSTSGELVGTSLEPISTTEAYWFCWVAAYPGTELFE